MTFDEHTLKDLEIFEATDGGMSIFQLFDRTYSQGGSGKLKEMFLKGCLTPEEARENTQAIRYMEPTAQDPLLKIHKNQFVFIEQYLNSKLPSLKRETIFGFFNMTLKLALSHKETGLFSNLEYISEGTGYVRNFLMIMFRFSTESIKNSAPGPVKQLADEVRIYMDRVPRFFRLGEKKFRYNVTGKLRCDKWARGRGRVVLDRLKDIFYTLDAYRALAQAKQEMNLSFGNAGESDSFDITGMYHPFIDSPVTLDFAMEKNFLFLTGPNMAGKTTFLKSLGISVYLAHLGFPLFAESFKVPWFNALFTSIHTDDNVRAGYSYFFSEINRVKAAGELLQSGKKALVIFDELFKGTNVKDAFDASRIVIDKMVTWDKSFFILSSHLLEIAEELEAPDKIDFRYFNSSVVDGRPHFSYTLKTGVSSERLGLLLLKLAGVDVLLDNSGTTPQI